MSASARGRGASTGSGGTDPAAGAVSGGSTGLVGLLAEPARLRVVGALCLGAGTVAEVVARDRAGATGGRRRRCAGWSPAGWSAPRRASCGCARSGSRQAARAAAPVPAAGRSSCRPTRRPRRCCGPSSGTGGSSPSRSPGPSGGCCSSTSRRSSSRACGIRSARSTRCCGPGTTTMRRCAAYLVDEQLLGREDGEYWRIGGWVETARGAGRPAAAGAAHRRVRAGVARAGPGRGAAHPAVPRCPQWPVDAARRRRWTSASARPTRCCGSCARRPATTGGWSSCSTPTPSCCATSGPGSGSRPTRCASSTGWRWSAGRWACWSRTARPTRRPGGRGTRSPRTSSPRYAAAVLAGGRLRAG